MDPRTYTPLQKIVSKAHHHELLGKCLWGDSGGKAAGGGWGPTTLASVKPLSEMQAEVSAWHWDPSVLQLSRENRSSILVHWACLNTDESGKNEVHQAY